MTEKGIDESNFVGCSVPFIFISSKLWREFDLDLEKGIGSQVHYVPVPMMPYYANKLHGELFPNAISYYRKCLSLPCFPTLTDSDLNKVCDGIKQELKWQERMKK